MKRLFFVMLIAVLGGAAAFSQAQKTMYVVVKSTPVKSSTGFFARTVKTLALGDTVTAVRESGKWTEVRSGSVSGFVAATSLSSKRVTGSGNSASAGEIALAGKGFSPETEKEFKNVDKLDYSGVDAMERLTVSESDLLKFISDGHLSKGE